MTLAVSHADCEDLADRIRARLIDAGTIGGDAIVGPGWGGGAERSYAEGDRVLLYTKPGIDGLHNGSVGTVVAVGSQGLRVDFDDVGEVVLRAAFVQGRRHDGNPNLSHAWARTIDGPQGGTWARVHLPVRPAPLRAPAAWRCRTRPGPGGRAAGVGLARAAGERAPPG